MRGAGKADFVPLKITNRNNHQKKKDSTSIGFNCGGGFLILETSRNKPKKQVLKLIFFSPTILGRLRGVFCPKKVVTSLWRKVNLGTDYQALTKRAIFLLL